MICPSNINEKRRSLAKHYELENYLLVYFKLPNFYIYDKLFLYVLKLKKIQGCKKKYRG